MITIKKKHNLSNSSQFNELLSKFNNVIRYAYNRKIKNNISKHSELEQYVKSNMNNISCLDASWIKQAVKLATELNTDNKLYFGGKFNFFKSKYKKINGYDKNVPLSMRGSCNDKGNRKASIKNNILTFKPYKGLAFDIILSLSKNEKKLLNIIEQRCLLKQDYFNIKIDTEYVWISFNIPTINKHQYKKNRYLGIDLNPNWIALSIVDKDSTDIIYKEIIDLRLINKTNINKKRYELAIINKHIVDICKRYNVEYVCLEDLVISSSNKGLGRRYNKSVNNDWNRNYIVNNLVKWLSIYGIKYLLVNPFYTSFIGQMKNINDYDSVGASIEIAYRGFLMIKNIKDGSFKMYDYVNKFLGGLVSTRWKNMIPNVNTYKDLYNHFKIKNKSKNSYRFIFNEVEKQKWSFFRLKSYKSLIDLIII